MLESTARATIRDTTLSIYMYVYIYIYNIYKYINGEEHLANIVSVKTQSFGLKWRPHRSHRYSIFHVLSAIPPCSFPVMTFNLMPKPLSILKCNLPYRV